MRIATVSATYDALEWIHSVDEHYRQDAVYSSPTDIDSEAGGFILGALGARNASHHGLRQVVEYVEVERPLYAARNYRWEHTGMYAPDTTDSQLRWIRELPLRQEVNGDPGTIRSRRLEQAFLNRLSGREVRNSLAMVSEFLFFTARNRPLPPSTILTADQHASNIDRRDTGKPN